MNTLFARLQAAGYALGFLTRLPVPAACRQPGEASPVFWFIPVGAVFGAVLVGVAALALSLHLPPMAAAALVLVAWCGFGSTLHLDGLADCADGWMSGQSGKDLLRILKDQRTGTGAVVAVALVLIIKFAALTELFYRLNPAILWAAPFTARAALACFIVETPYVSNGGLGTGLRERTSRPAVWATTLLCLAAVAAAAPLLALACAAGTLLALGLIRPLVRRLGGANGDVYGAFVEMTECAILLLGAAWVY